MVSCNDDAWDLIEFISYVVTASVLHNPWKSQHIILKKKYFIDLVALSFRFDTSD